MLYRERYFHAGNQRNRSKSRLIAQLMAQQGMGLDAVSGGELMVAKQADFPMARISFHGNNKSEDELRLALKLGVGRIVLDNCAD